MIFFIKKTLFTVLMHTFATPYNSTWGKKQQQHSIIKYRLTMTKAEIIQEISLKTGVEKNQVQEVVESFFKVVRNNMTEGKNVYFRGFGSFIIKRRAKKIARNISKNTAMVIDEHYIPSFKPAKTFVEKIKKSEMVKTTAAKREAEAKQALKEA
jgi:DNA-binding protein HU-beta